MVDAEPPYFSVTRNAYLRVGPLSVFYSVISEGITLYENMLYNFFGIPKVANYLPLGREGVWGDKFIYFEYQYHFMGVSPLPPGTGMAAGFAAGLVVGALLGPLVILSLPFVVVASPLPP